MRRLILSAVLLFTVVWAGCRPRQVERPKTHVAERPEPSPAAVSEDPPTSPPKRIGNVTIYPAEKRIELKASVCLTQGILDYLAVAPESGKEYESLLRFNCKPSSLHAALLALGGRPGRLPLAFMGDGRGIPKEGKAPEREGDRVRVDLSWQADGTEQRTPVETWLIDRSTKRSPAPLEWVFTGSFFGKYPDGQEVYAADVEKLVMGMWYHAACVLNVASDAGSPYRGDKLGFEINTANVPPINTEVLVNLQLISRKEGPEGSPR